MALKGSNSLNSYYSWPSKPWMAWCSSMSAFPTHVSPYYAEKPGRNWARARSVWSPSLPRQRRAIRSFPSKWGATIVLNHRWSPQHFPTKNPIHTPRLSVVDEAILAFPGGHLQVLATYRPFPPASTPQLTNTCLTFPLPCVAGSIIGSRSTCTPRALRIHLWTMPETPSNTGFSATCPHRYTTPPEVAQGRLTAHSVMCHQAVYSAHRWL